MWEIQCSERVCRIKPWEMDSLACQGVTYYWWYYIKLFSETLFCVFLGFFWLLDWFYGVFLVCICVCRGAILILLTAFAACFPSWIGLLHDFLQLTAAFSSLQTRISPREMNCYCAEAAKQCWAWYCYSVCRADYFGGCCANEPEEHRETFLFLQRWEVLPLRSLREQISQYLTLEG